ncbi:DUF805 domain-containing protein [Amantichitinum ursilacus]|uniref:Inner membrane protein YhaH n=1 Tax=Amantichitinum ursilacus TaxID=857265 RepID=A0A0N0GR13_9NEIS|nr:DUF805 domain-containing protein [Amantichitinum ursilacus]KPC55390.1 Inner membrane protein YhaH [Amantichitinum ursilacus]
MNYFEMFFFAQGRITRLTYAWRLLVLAIACTALGSLFGDVAGALPAALFAAIFVYGAVALSAKRLHDIGRGAWILLVAVVPVLGPLWLLFQLLRAGVTGSNRFGADPAARAGYLVVELGK